MKIIMMYIFVLTGEDEFNLIARHFNDMVLQIKNSKQQKEKGSIERKKCGNKSVGSTD